MKKIILLLTVVFASVTISFCQPGSIDVSFGKKGFVETDLGINKNFSSIARQVLLDSDASMYVVFESSEFTSIVKKRPDGSTDSSYGFNGISVSVHIQGPHALIQPDGKIIIAGRILKESGYDPFLYVTTNYDFALVRFNTDGSLDHTFDNDGVTSTDFTRFLDIATAMALQTDGKIVVAGFSATLEEKYDSTGNEISLGNIAIARYNKDGSLDNTFNGNGKLITNFKTYFTPYISTETYNLVGVQSDGKIVLAGSNDSGLILTRFNSNGTPDNTFNLTNKLFNSDGSYFAPKSLAIQNDQKIVLGGSWKHSKNKQDFVVARFDANGNIDNSFDNDGIKTTDFRTYDDIINSIAIQGDGKVVAVGSASNGSNDAFAIARYNVDGSPDNSFDGDGKKMIFLTSNNVYANDVVVQTNGRLLAAGYEQAGSNQNIVLIRYNNNGTLDSSLHKKGYLVYNLNLKSTIYKSTAIQKDGKIVTVGYCWNGTNSAFAIARYNANGSLDNSFDGDGSLILPIGTNDYATSVAIQSDGKILVAGYAFINSNYDFAVVRLNTNGSLDNTFSGDGKLTTDFDLRPNYARSIVITTDGKIIVGGGFDIARYNADGTPDNTFDGDGKLNTNNNDLNSLCIQSDGKIVAVSNNSLIRYNNNGSPDNTFASNGSKALTVHDLFPELEEWDYGYSIIITQVHIQNDGKILVAGFGGAGERYASYQYRAFVARYNSDGSLDISYAGDGTQQVPFYDLSNNTSIALQNDGKVIVAANIVTDFQYSYDGYNLIQTGFAFARLTIDGGLDYTFGSNGIQNVESDQVVSIENIAIANNKLYAVGYEKSISNSGFLTRYLLGENKAPTVSLTNPVNNAVYFSPAIITLNASASDSDGVISFVQFYNGGTLLNKDSISPYTYTINNVAAGTYSFTAKATDNKGLRSSSAGASVTVLSAPNKAPVVKITSPANNKIYTAPATIILTAAASDSDGTISRVDFYDGGTLLKTDSTSPYTFTMSNVGAANYSFVAKATDNKGLSSSSASVPVAVSMPANKAPVVKLISPTNNAVYFSAGSITISAAASDSDGIISKVQFYKGNSLLNTDSISPYTYSISNVASGNYSFVAKAFDEKGLRSSSASVAITVLDAPNKAPAVKMISPANNTFFLAPATINLSATASDADGTISTVQFYNGGVLIKTDSTSPYSFTMNNVARGRYSFVAKATDNKGLSNSSTSVPVFVGANKKPVVQIITPGDNAVYYTPVTATLIANASDSDGTISYVEFYNGQALIKKDSTRDYSLSLNNLAPGSYSLIAKATDNYGLVSSSPVVHVTVLARATLEAEDASILGAVVAANQPGFTGTGFVDFIHASDDLIDWYNVTTTTPGQYLLEFRYANGGATNRPLELAIDYYLIDASMNFPPTGSWANWSTSSISVNLSPGTHHIWLFSSGSNGPNVDHLVFGSDNSAKLVAKSLAQQNILSEAPKIFKAFLSPNPVQDQAKLLVSSSSELPITMQLVDILGRNYKSVRFVNKGSNTFDFSVKELPEGSYIIILKQGQLTTHVQFIIAKK